MKSTRKQFYYNHLKLQAARLQKGWTRTFLADVCGLHYSTVSRVESGEHQNPATVKVIAHHLKVNMADIVKTRPVRQALAALAAVREEAPPEIKEVLAPLDTELLLEGMVTDPKGLPE